LFKQQLDKVRLHYRNAKAALLGKTPEIDVDDPSYDAFVTEIEHNGKIRQGIRVGEKVFLR